ncbi:MAG: glycosyltransferase [Rhizobiaceae bacterium]|nr:glycosyltransferase [Rhizobiaceae bacterium]
MTPFTIVMEMENATLITGEEVREVIDGLARQIAGYVTAHPGARPQIVFVQAGEHEETVILADLVTSNAGALMELADFEFVSVPDGRYYQLKNTGIDRARGEIIILLDSDALAEPGWLDAMLAPFADPKTVVVNGHTFLHCDDFASRAFALIWFFPLRNNDERQARKRSLNANNCAFRGDWIRKNRFPDNNGFKVSCTLLVDEMRRQGIEMRRVPAYTKHAAPRGAQFYFWRALVTGRDADRKFALRRSPSRLRRIRHSLGHWFTLNWRAIRRIVNKGRDTGMPAWQIPGAIAVSLAFYSLAFVGQLGLASGLVSDTVERIPEGVEHS